MRSFSAGSSRSATPDSMASESRFSLKVGFGGALVQFGDVLATTVRQLLSSVEDGGQHLLNPLGLQQPVLDMVGHRSSSFSIGIERPLLPVSPCRALIEQVS
jgi:hypothetical protein